MEGTGYKIPGPKLQLGGVLKRVASPHLTDWMVRVSWQGVVTGSRAKRCEWEKVKVVGERSSRSFPLPFPTDRICGDDILTLTCPTPYKPTYARMEHEPVDLSPKMNPSNIEQHTVDYILEFISPPSNLRAIPVHELSIAMMRRHHFLGISPHTPHEYLSWPSSDDGKAGKEAIDLLERYYTYAVHYPYTTVYTSDGDYTYGHVALSCPELDEGIRLVFQWDFSTESWKYHDLKTMPFPDRAKSTPQAVSPFSTRVMSTPTLVTVGGSPTSEGDDDAYWNAYGGDEDGQWSHGRPTSASINDPGSEDAYWAQYSAIQGWSPSSPHNPVLL